MANDIELLLVLIRRFEGLRLEPYLCPAGVWTVGYGATRKGVIPGKAWTRQQAEDRLIEDALLAYEATLKLCPVLAEHPARACAIADFTYNLGVGALRASTLRRTINAEDFSAVPSQLARWVYAGGKRLNGLVLRRIAETTLWNYGGRS